MKRLLFGVLLGVIRRARKETHAGMGRDFGITEKQYEDLEAAQHEPRAGLWGPIADKYPGMNNPVLFSTWVDEELVDLIFGRKS